VSSSVVGAPSVVGVALVGTSFGLGNAVRQFQTQPPITDFDDPKGIRRTTYITKGQMDEWKKGESNGLGLIIFFVLIGVGISYSVDFIRSPVAKAPPKW
jgi:hypothetical protein